MTAITTTHRDLQFFVDITASRRATTKSENISTKKSTTTTKNMGKEDWPETIESHCADEAHLGNFYNAVNEQERQFEPFYKVLSNTSKIKQRLWVVLLELNSDETGAEAFKRRIAEKILKWAVGQEEEGPNTRGRFIRVAIMTKKHYTYRRIKTLLHLGSTQIRAGLAARGCVILATDISRRAPDTELIEYGDYPPPTMEDEDSADDEADDDDDDDGAGGREAILDEALKLDSAYAAMNYIKQKDRLWYISSQKQLRSFVEGEITDKSNRALYGENEFNTPLLDLHSPDHKNKAVVLIGPTGLGKTQWALAHFKNPVHIRDKNDYSRITECTDGLVLDDLDQMHWQPLTLLKLVECETNVTMNIKYGSKIIPAGMPRFIISNSWELFWPKNFRAESIEAVERRVVSYAINEKLFGATAAPRTLKKFTRLSFLFVANNIGLYVELGKTKRAARLGEMAAEEAKEKYRHLNLNFAKSHLSSAGRGGTLPGGPQDAPGRSLQDNAAVGGAQVPKAVPHPGPGQDVVPLADDGPDDV